MKNYETAKIKNVALVGHGGSGKTSLAEAILYFTGNTDRLGKIADGNTVCDFDPEEIKRVASLSISLAPVEWKDNKINLIDAPGLFDFAGGMTDAVLAAGTSLIVLSGKSGVTVGAQKAYKLSKKYNRSTMFFVTKLDTENADFYKVLEDLKSNFGASVCPVVVPFVENGKISCYINLINMKAYSYNQGKASEVPMPDTQHRLDGLITAISEAVAETDEVLFEKYFSGEKFTQEELISGFHAGVKSGTVSPVYCGSGITMDGVDMLLDGMSEILPAASEYPPETGINDKGETVQISYDENGPLAAYVFKTIADPFVGKMSFFKVISGKINSGTAPVNATTGNTERMGKLISVRGKKQTDEKEFIAGDIGVVAKMNEVNTGDTLCDSARVVKITGMDYPKSCYTMSVKAKNQNDETKISSAISRLIEEDLTLSFKVDPETHQHLLSGLGEQHLDVSIAKLKNKFGVDVLLEQPVIPYRETLRKKVKVEGKHKKQSGGHGQYGHVWIEFEPCVSDALVFEEKVFGGAVPKNFFPAVEKGLQEAMSKGVIAGYPVVNLKATLVDGSYHDVDSSEMAFKIAAAQAYRTGLEQASPALLEPIGKLSVYVPDGNTGDMMGELNKRRGRVLGMTPFEEGITVIEAETPIAEMHDFATLTRQITQGQGWFELEFERYEQLPQMLEADVIAKAKAQEE